MSDTIKIRNIRNTHIDIFEKSEQQNLFFTMISNKFFFLKKHCSFVQIDVNLDMKNKMSGIFSATRIGNIQQEQEQIEPQQLDFGRQQEETKLFYQKRK